ncbi:MAG: hypothetical protein HYZ16_00580 [Bacteroidetes bacterium]|jgi:hypothetical protein|nr:hypothetical protein [Bacteroidota bacterium]
MRSKIVNLTCLSVLIIGLMAASACRQGAEPDEVRRIRQRGTKCLDRSLVGDNSACEKVRRPVCGCNGKTYPNACYAEKAGVAHYGAGTCEEQR